MNKLGRVLACTTLAATLTMTSLTGCGNTLDGTKTVATVGKEEITAGTVNMMLRMTQAQMMSYYSMFGTSTTGMWENKGDDGKTYAESTKDDIMDQLHNLVLLEQHAKDYDVTITDKEQKELKIVLKVEEIPLLELEEHFHNLERQKREMESLLTEYRSSFIIRAAYRLLRKKGR